MMRAFSVRHGGWLAVSLTLLLAGCSDSGTTAAADDDDDVSGAAGKKTGGAGQAGQTGRGTGGKGGSLSGGSGQGSQAGQDGGFPVGGAPGKGGAAGVGAAGGASGAGTGAAAGTTGASDGGSGVSGSGAAGQSTGTAGSPPVVNCAGDPSVDNDGDGFSEAQGDCNDCDPNANPGAVDIITLNGDGTPSDTQADEDCDGVVLQPGQDVCDQGIGIDDGDPIKGAFAMDICKVAQGNSWGIVSAEYIQIDGGPLGGNGPLGHGVLPKFGPVATLRGSSMLALSSGTARDPGQPGYSTPGGFNQGTDAGSPPGFPLESSACPGVTTGAPHDSVALRLTLRVPTNAKSFSFKFKFYTYEYPNFICSIFNDFFTVLMDPPPADVNPINKNITFDKQNNPVSVNNAFLEVCQPGDHGGKSFSCPAGTGDLQGTGFETGGATLWLETKAPVVPGSTITLTFGAFDSGDHILDSTGLVDDFRWSADPAEGTSTGKP